MKKIFTIICLALALVACTKNSEEDIIVINSGEHNIVPFVAISNLEGGDATRAIVENNLPKWELGDTVRLAYTKADRSFGQVDLTITQISNNGASARIEGNLIDPAERSVFYAVYGGEMDLTSWAPKSIFKYYNTDAISDYELNIVNQFFNGNLSLEEYTALISNWHYNDNHLRIYAMTEEEAVTDLHTLQFHHAQAFIHITGANRLQGSYSLLLTNLDNTPWTEKVEYYYNNNYYNILEQEHMTDHNSDDVTSRITNNQLMCMWSEGMTDFYISIFPTTFQNGVTLAYLPGMNGLGDGEMGIASYGTNGGKAYQAGHIYEMNIDNILPFGTIEDENTTMTGSSENELDYESSLLYYQDYLNGDIGALSHANSFNDNIIVHSVTLHTNNIPKSIRKSLAMQITDYHPESDSFTSHYQYAFADEATMTATTTRYQLNQSFQLQDRVDSGEYSLLSNCYFNNMFFDMFKMNIIKDCIYNNIPWKTSDFYANFYRYNMTHDTVENQKLVVAADNQRSPLFKYAPHNSVDHINIHVKIVMEVVEGSCELSLEKGTTNEVYNTYAVGNHTIEFDDVIENFRERSSSYNVYNIYAQTTADATTNSGKTLISNIEVTYR